MRQLTIVQSITNRDSACLDKYLQEIAKLPMITPEEEIELSGRIRQGDEKAIASLAKANLRFVVSVAKQYQHRGLHLTDLINEGNIGLLQAAKKFDESKGFKFISYAVWWIRQSILMALITKARMVRLPSNRINTQNRILNCTAQMEQELERSPSFNEISQRLNITAAEVEQIGIPNFHHQSLDQPLSSETTDGTFLDQLVAEENSTDEELAYTTSLQVEVERCLATLPANQRLILCSFYGIGKAEKLSLEMIGKRLGLSTERVRQIKRKAIMHLQMPGSTKVLKPFLG